LYDRFPYADVGMRHKGEHRSKDGHDLLRLVLYMTDFNMQMLVGGIRVNTDPRMDMTYYGSFYI